MQNHAILNNDSLAFISGACSGWFLGQLMTGGQLRAGSEKGAVESRQSQGGSAGQVITGKYWRTGSEKGVVEGRQ